MTIVRVPVDVVRVPVLWPPRTLARVSNRTIYVVEGVRLTAPFLAHELAHILQRERLGWRFLFAYVWGWARAGFRYERNRMELEAELAARDPVMLTWADAVLRDLA